MKNIGRGFPADSSKKVCLNVEKKERKGKRKINGDVNMEFGRSLLLFCH